MADILNLGCGNKLVIAKDGETVINHDLAAHRPEVTAVADLNDVPWPWADNSFDMVVARAVLEHLRINLIESANECWRILRPEGILYLKLPVWNSDNAWRDPTHYWRFSLSTCDIFDPETSYGQQYSFYTERKWRIIQAAKMNKAKTSFALKMQVRK